MGSPVSLGDGVDQQFGAAVGERRVQFGAVGGPQHPGLGIGVGRDLHVGVAGEADQLDLVAVPAVEVGQDDGVRALPGHEAGPSALRAHPVGSGAAVTADQQVVLRTMWRCRGLGDPRQVPKHPAEPVDVRVVMVDHEIPQHRYRQDRPGGRDRDPGQHRRPPRPTRTSQPARPGRPASVAGAGRGPPSTRPGPARSTARIELQRQAKRGPTGLARALGCRHATTPHLDRASLAEVRTPPWHF